MSVQYVRSVYAEKEPAGTDAWSPLWNDVELWHRVRLQVELVAALRALGGDIGSMTLLDVGCGVGRSTRMFVELGFSPQNILGVDLRESALDTARAFNPAISYRHLRDLSEWPAQKFDLVSQCTAFSSMPAGELRGRTAELMAQSASEGGAIFWWDSLLANGFAGGDPLDPSTFFPGRSLLMRRNLKLPPSLADAMPAASIRQRLMFRIASRMGGASHCAAIFK